MGTGDGTNFMPNDRSGALRLRNAWLSQRKAFDALGVKMDLALVDAGEALQQFGKRAFGAVPAVNKG